MVRRGGFVAVLVTAAGVAVEDPPDLGRSAGGADGVREHRGEHLDRDELARRRCYMAATWPSLITDCKPDHGSIVGRSGSSALTSGYTFPAFVTADGGLLLLCPIRGPRDDQLEACSLDSGAGSPAFLTMT